MCYYSAIASQFENFVSRKANIGKGNHKKKVYDCPKLEKPAYKFKLGSKCIWKGDHFDHFQIFYEINISLIIQFL